MKENDNDNNNDDPQKAKGMEKALAAVVASMSGECVAVCCSVLQCLTSSCHCI